MEYSGDVNNIKSSAECNFNVIKNTIYNMEISAKNISIGEDEIITVNVPSDANGFVIFDVNGIYYAANAVNALATLTIKNLKVGDYTVTASYSDDYYELVNVTTTFTVYGSSEFSMNVSVDDITVGEVAHVIVNLPTDAIGYVDLYINDNYYRDTGVRGGVATFDISGLAPGNYTIKAIYSGDNNYSSHTTTCDFVVNKIHITVTPTALSTTYDSGKYFTVKVVNTNGSVVRGLKLSLKVYTGSSYSTVTVTTDANGIAKYSASKLSIATHKVVINVPNTNYFVDSNKNSTIKVSKAPTTVTAKKVKAKKGAKKYFKVTIKNKTTGKIIKSLTLKIKVYTGKKYKTYKVKTNSKGIAKLSTRYLKKGTHKVVISTTSKYYTVKKSGKLIVIK